MNTKSKIIAILMASVMAISIVAMAMPAMGKDVPSEATVGNDAPYVCCKTEEPDDYPAIPGIQINPDPNGPKTITILACVCDPNGNDDIQSVAATVTGPGGFNKNVALNPSASVDCSLCNCTPAPSVPCVGYNGTFTMDPCDKNGNYTVAVTATDKGGKFDILENLYEYMSIISLELTFVEVNYGDVAVDVDTYVTPGQIHNKGNDNMTVTISATNMDRQNPPPVAAIPATKLDAKIAGQELWDLSGAGQTFAHIFQCCVPANVTFSIHPPQGTPQGIYKGTVTITGNKVA